MEPRKKRGPVLLLGLSVFLFASVQLAPIVRETWSARVSGDDSDVLSNPMLTFTGSNQAWIVNVTLPAPATQLKYRIGEAGEWNDTGQSQSVDPSTGRPLAMSFFQMPASQKPTTIFISWIDLHGRESPVYPLPFDPNRERVAAVRRFVEPFWMSWVAFRDMGKQRLIYFTTLVTYRCGIHSIRYGLDGAPATTPFELPPCRDVDGVFGVIPSDATVYLTVPQTTQSITVDITFGDGAHAKTRTFRAADNGL